MCKSMILNVLYYLGMGKKCSRWWWEKQIHDNSRFEKCNDTLLLRDFNATTSTSDFYNIYYDFLIFHQNRTMWLAGG